MKQVTSKRTGLEQIISDEVYNDLVKRGWHKRFDVIDLPEKTLKEVPKIIPVEVKTKTKKNGQKN